MTNAKPATRPLNDDETDTLTALLTDSETRLRDLSRKATTPAERNALWSVADSQAALRDLLYSNRQETVQAEMVRAEQQAEAEARRVKALGQVEAYAASTCDAYEAGEQAKDENATGKWDWNETDNPFRQDDPQNAAWNRGLKGLPRLPSDQPVA